MTLIYGALLRVVTVGGGDTESRLKNASGGTVIGGAGIAHAKSVAAGILHACSQAGAIYAFTRFSVRHALRTLQVIPGNAFADTVVAS
jgi:hypothetical protein